MDIVRSPDLPTLKLLSNQLLQWLFEDALPLWDEYGVDRNSGGYFEKLTFNAQTRAIEVLGTVRRGRVVARQIFVFNAGKRLGWQSVRSDPVRHGCDFLFSRLHARDGAFHASVDVLTNRPDPQFSLYEIAFYLFALARLQAPLDEDYRVRETAVACLSRLRRGWSKAKGGFEESNPPTLPLKSNPHMHLFEAALAWIGVAQGPQRAVWVELAEEIVDLCCTRFIDAETGAICEYYDAEWQPLADETGGIIEPGHQFEWAWLLMQWAASPHCGAERRESYRAAARRLVHFGETWGVDPARGVAFNELWGDMTPKDFAAKLWPQTERLKAWCAMFEHARTPQDAEGACRKISEAAAGLTRYFSKEPPGMWQELQLSDGSFTSEPCKASSFYHIVCAIETLRQTASNGNFNVLY